MENSIHYGSCEITHHSLTDRCLGNTHVRKHPAAKSHIGYVANRPTEFVWLPSTDLTAGGRLHAYAETRSLENQRRSNDLRKWGSLRQLLLISRMRWALV